MEVVTKPVWTDFDRGLLAMDVTEAYDFGDDRMCEVHVSAIGSRMGDLQLKRGLEKLAENGLVEVQRWDWRQANNSPARIVIVLEETDERRQENDG